MAQRRGKKRKLADTTTAATDGGEVKVSSTSPCAWTHWLMKSEPESRIEKGVDMKFSFEDLKAMPSSTSCWDGVRNYQAGVADPDLFAGSGSESFPLDPDPGSFPSYIKLYSTIICKLSF